MYRFHSRIRTIGLALALSGVMAAGAVGSALAATGGRAASVIAPDDHSGSRAATALNLLEARGYGDFDNFHRVGRMYAATITRDRRTMHLTIDPDTGRIEKRDS